MAASNELPQSLLNWVTELTGVQITGTKRHQARREAWQIDGVSADGSAAHYFLRIDRDLAEGVRLYRHLRREAGLIRALSEHGIPAQTILGWNDEHCAALQSWVEGRAELNRETRGLQHSVMLDFMGILARLHRIDIKTLALPEFVVPESVAAHSLLELAAIEESGRSQVLASAINPLAAFGKRWLINHAPTQVQATVLLQGDTGPANFMFDERGVTAVVDWEWGHYGDPMEDLGNIWLRDFFYPSSNYDLAPYFAHYAKATGFRLDYDSIRYYRAHQLVRSVVGLTYLNQQLDWRTPIPLNMGYSAVIDVQTCLAIAEASGLPATPPPAATQLDLGGTSLLEALALQIEHWVSPQISDAAAAFVSRGHADTLRYLDRRTNFGAAFDAQELQGISQLLGANFDHLEDARKALISRIETLAPAAEAPVLAHLTQVAHNQAALMAPLTTLWRDRRWARIEAP